MSFIWRSSYQILALTPTLTLILILALVHRYEDLVRMSARAVVRLVGSFLQLHVDDAVVALASKQGCDPSSGRHAQSFVARSPTADRDLAGMAPTLEHLFAPYDELLRELLGARFIWTPEDHRLKTISEEERSRRAAALDEIVKKRTARISRQRDERARRQREVAEHRKKSRLG